MNRAGSDIAKGAISASAPQVMRYGPDSFSIWRMFVSESVV